MAYTKTTWNNLSDPPINADNLNKIEQGIYNNSLGIDKINPSGTATTTAEIEEGQINDVIGFKSLKLKGQTSQYTTQGNNLLNIYARHPAGYTETVSGVTITYNDDGSVNAKGTATADIAYLLATDGQLGDDIFNGTNYLSGCTGGSLTTFFLQFWANTIGRFQNVTTEVATNKTAGVSWNIAIIIISGVAIDKTFYPMMSATSGKTFEKYTGGKASPNPDFPQDVNNVSGDNIVGISNKNILPNPIQSQTLNGVTITRNSDGTLLINGTATANTYFDFSTDFDTTKYAGYKFYGFPDNPGFFIRISKSNRVALQDISSNGTVISDNGTGNYIAIRIASGANVNNRLLSPMIIAPTISDTSYAPHQENNFDIDLPIELCKIGTYADYIYKKDGKWWKHKAIKKIILNGTENWSYQSQYLRFFIDLSNSALTGARDSSKSNYFVYGDTESVNNTFFISTASRLLIRDESITSADNFKTWLSTHNTTLYYVLATPIDEEITYTPLIRQLDELYNSGLYDVTNISQDNSSEAFILDIEACKNNINGIVEYIRR